MDEEKSRPTRRQVLTGTVFGALALAGGAFGATYAFTRPEQTDVLIYGSTMAAVAAALQVRRMGRSVVLLNPDSHLGGMTTSGLGATDVKVGTAIGGIAREFYEAVYAHYRENSAWTAPSGREAFGKVSAQPGRAIDDSAKVMWHFEPKVAQKIVDTWIADAELDVRNGRIQLDGGVLADGGTITAVRTEDGSLLHAKMFIDASYEGDLMATAGVGYRLGRESSSDFGEGFAGVALNAAPFDGVDPYRAAGNEDQLLPHIEGHLDADTVGQGDQERIQAYCFRLCLSGDPENQLPIEPPKGYDPSEFELLFRFLETKSDTRPFTMARMPNRKIDANNASGFGFDYLGGNRNRRGVLWPEASYRERQAMWDEHKRYQLAYLWAVRNESRVPTKVRELANSWSLAADEFSDTGGWPPQLYVREARRMTGAETITEKHQLDPDGAAVSNSIGLGSYSMDSHAVRRVVVDGMVRTEGGFYRKLKRPWSIPYGSITPPRESVANLLVACALSTTHVALGSTRMEPTYMIIGQSAGAAAVLALEERDAVQDVPYEKLAGELRKAGQRLAEDDRGKTREG